MTMVHSARQLEMLELMGIDVWRLRERTETDQSGIDRVSASNSVSSDTQVTENTSAETTTTDAMPARWVAVASGPTIADWLLICETDQSGLEPNTAAGRLYVAVLGALGLSKEEVITVCSAPMVETIAGVDAVSLESLLENLFAGRTPKIVVVLGENCARGLLQTNKELSDLRTEKYRYQGGRCVLIVTHSLHWLLNNPADKAELWSDLQKASEIVNAR